MRLIVRARGDARDIGQLGPNDPVPDGWVEYDGDPLWTDDEGNWVYVIIPDPPYIRPPTQGEMKAAAAEVKTQEIYREQELRSMTVIGFKMPQEGFALMEELYADILLPAARKSITEQDTPRWWGLKELRNNRNTLLAGLQQWIDDPAKTSDDILAFDVSGWAGWSIARP